MKPKTKRSEYRTRESALQIILSAACLWESRARIGSSRAQLHATRIPPRLAAASSLLKDG